MSMWDRPMTASADEETGNFPVSVPGEYEYTVSACVGKEYPGGAKMAKCPQLALELMVEGKDASGKSIDVKVFENLYANPKTEWKLLSFAKSIGIYHDNITVREIMDKCRGQIGKAKIKVDTYNGKTRNVIDRFLPAPADELPF